MNIKLLATLSVLTISACGGDQSTPIVTPQTVEITEPLDPIYLLIRGQSNAIGVPETPLTTSYEPTENVKYWHVEYQDWVTAELGNLEVVRKDLPNHGTYTFALTAAKEISEYYDRPVRYINNAVSGSRFELWTDGGQFEIEKELISDSGAVDVIVLSHQGESHRFDKPAEFLSTVAKYEELLEGTDWYGGLIVHGELFEGGDYDAQNPQIKTLSHVASSFRLTSTGDNIHFDSASLSELGKRYAYEVIQSGIIPPSY